ncbi:MAG TPA: M14 family metallopeptidase [Thermoanaerobaculia bacterium]|nr:M14 family metallopeptidase [Thermoanaerobaculia bacterium]
MPQELPKTTAESTNYRATSRYADVVAFISAIQRIDPDVRVETFATTNEGRALPLVIAGPPGVVDPRTARASGLPIVFIMANIHAGEVEGKEAAQMLLRDLVSKSRKLRNDMVVLIAPIYNADGNEPISTEHRKTQNGPPEGVGVRENAQGLDLNRDYMKLESPEARGLVANVLNRWDPLLTVDLHTTNGSFHGYQLTYAPMLNPNADSDLIDFSRDTLLPQIRKAMRENHRKETYYYGNFLNQLTPEKGWYTFDSRPRFGNNYVGLRNRFTILSEAYSYIDFRARVEVTYDFLQEILSAVQKLGKKMLRLAASADRARLKKQGVRFEIKPWKTTEILWEKCVPEDGANLGAENLGETPHHLRRTGQIILIKMTDYGVFAPTEKDDVPFAFLIDPTAHDAIQNLRTHGIIVEVLAHDTPLEVEQFAIKTADRSEHAFQKHNELTLTGKWKSRNETVAGGTYVVRMNQPLARLAFYLLDPRSDDGLFEWNFFDTMLEEKIAPVQRVMKPVALDAIVVGEK